MRSSEAICANRSWLARAAATPSSTSFWPRVGERADLQARVDDGEQQRHGDQRQAEQHQTVQGFGARPAHGARIVTACRAAANLQWLPACATPAGSLPGLALELPLPVQRGAHDRVQIVQLRAPAEEGADPVGAGDQDRGIAGAAGRFDHLEGVSLRSARRSPAPRARCSRGRSRSSAYCGSAAAAQVIEGLQVRRWPDLRRGCSRARPCHPAWVVRAENRHVRALADRCLAGHLDQQGRLSGRLADAAVRIRSGDVEVAQRDIAQLRGGSRDRAASTPTSASRCRRD